MQFMPLIAFEACSFGILLFWLNYSESMLRRNLKSFQSNPIKFYLKRDLLRWMKYWIKLNIFFSVHSASSSASAGFYCVSHEIVVVFIVFIRLMKWCIEIGMFFFSLRISHFHHWKIERKKRERNDQFRCNKIPMSL